MLDTCKAAISFGQSASNKEKKTKKKKGKTAVTLRDSLDVNKEALAKVCKCHDVQRVFLFYHLHHSQESFE